MKKILVILLACALLFTACNTNKMADEFNRLPADERLVLELPTEDQLKLVSEMIVEAERLAKASVESDYYKKYKDTNDVNIELIDGALQGIEADKQNPKKALDGILNGVDEEFTVQDFKDAFILSSYRAYNTRKYSDLEFDEINDFYNAIMNMVVDEVFKDQDQIDQFDKIVRQELTDTKDKDQPASEAFNEVFRNLQKTLGEMTNNKEK